MLSIAKIYNKVGSFLQFKQGLKIDLVALQNKSIRNIGQDHWFLPGQFDLRALGCPLAQTDLSLLLPLDQLLGYRGSCHFVHTFFG